MVTHISFQILADVIRGKESLPVKTPCTKSKMWTLVPLPTNIHNFLKQKWKYNSTFSQNKAMKRAICHNVDEIFEYRKEYVSNCTMPTDSWFCDTNLRGISLFWVVVIAESMIHSLYQSPITQCTWNGAYLLHNHSYTSTSWLVLKILHSTPLVLICAKLWLIGSATGLLRFGTFLQGFTCVGTSQTVNFIYFIIFLSWKKI